MHFGKSQTCTLLNLAVERVSSPVKFFQGFVEIALVDEFGDVRRRTLNPTLLGVNADVVLHPFQVEIAVRMPDAILCSIPIPCGRD